MSADSSDVAPSITSPLSGATYTLRADRIEEERVPLAANAEGDVRALYWFVDDAFVAVTKPGVMLPWRPPHTGSFQLRVVDDRGRADSREMRIALAP